MFLNNEQRTFLVKENLKIGFLSDSCQIKEQPCESSKQKVFKTPPQSLENLRKRKTEFFNSLRRNPEFVKNSIVKCKEKPRNVSIIKVVINSKC